MPNEFPAHILCAVDFSDLSAAALRYCARLSAACGADITAVHAYRFEAPHYFTMAQTGALKRQYQNVVEEMRAALRQFLDKAGLTGVRTRIEEGDPAASVIRVAAETNAGLIVMGTHGRRGIERFMLGSVAERVLRMSSIPVLTVRLTAASGTVSRILCPVNNSEASRLAFQKAARLASCLGAQLTVAHIEEDDPPARIDDLCQWIAERERPDCKVLDLRGRGKPAEEILKLAAASAIDLLVIGAAHKAFFDSTILGTTTVRVVRHATCPVLTVPEGIGGKQHDLSGAVPKTAE